MHVKYRLLCEMLLVLVHRQVTDRLVWFSSMNALLFFVTHNGAIALHKYAVFVHGSLSLSFMFLSYLQCYSVGRESLSLV